MKEDRRGLALLVHDVGAIGKLSHNVTVHTDPTMGTLEKLLHHLTIAARLMDSIGWLANQPETAAHSCTSSIHA